MEGMENNYIQDIQTKTSDPIEQRVFRLETAVISMSKTEGEMMDRLKNAHHRIDETQNDQKDFKNEVRAKFQELNTKIDNIGTNLAKKDERDKKWRKWVVIIGFIAAGAFIGMFFQDSEIKKGIGEIALKLGAGAASVL